MEQVTKAPEHISFELHIESGELDEIRRGAGDEAAAHVGAAKPVAATQRGGLAHARFIDPVSAVVVVTMAWVAKRLVDHWLRDRERGVQFDPRKNPPVISRLEGIPQGCLVIIDKDGSAKVHQGKYERSEEVLPLLQALIAREKP